MTSVIDATIQWIYDLKPLVEPTVFLVPGFVRDQVEVLSTAIGFDVETLSYTLGMFLCYPLAIMMNSLPYGPMRHAFSFLLGAFLLQFTIGVQWIHHLISSLIVYALLLFLPRKTATYVVPAFAMGYLVFGHLHRQYVNYLGWDLDFTGTQMVLTQKLYMLAYNLYDGECLAKGIESKAAQKCKPFALREMPSLIEYLGYTFLFSNILSGPAFEYVTYANACSGALLYKADNKPRGEIPSNVMPALKAFLQCLVCLGMFVTLGGMYPIFDPVDPQKNTPVILTDEFLAQPWMKRYIYMWIGLFALRQKYYFAWKNAEGANNIWYVGFEGFDEKGQAKGWSGANNMNIIGFETAQNIQALSREWNKKTNLWLTRYVYIRTNGSLIAVYSLSAFWHGFYPGYYMFFLSVPLLTFVERLGKKKISPMFEDNVLYSLACWFITSFVIMYMIIAFQLLAFDRSFAAWKSHYFFGHILSIIAYVALSNIPSPKIKKID